MGGDLVPYGTPSRVSLDLPADLTFDQWEECGRSLGHAGETLVWLIGDWWNHGERAFGEAAACASRAGLNYGAARKAGWIAARIESARRRTDLTITHHGEVAALDADTADQLLAEAADNEWSTRKLRAEVKALAAADILDEEPADEEPAAQTHVYPDDDETAEGDEEGSGIGTPRGVPTPNILLNRVVGQLLTATEMLTTRVDVSALVPNAVDEAYWAKELENVQHAISKFRKQLPNR